MSGLVACKNCRQQKVRCTGRLKEGDPCDRCLKRGLECVVDNNYKRTVKRKAIEVLEAEIASLKQKLQEQSAWQPQKAQCCSTSLPAPKFEPPNAKIPKTGEHPREPLRLSAPVYPVDTWYCSPKTSQCSGYDPLTLDSASIELLFKEYVSFYHRVLPVVEVQRGPEFVYGASAALFWTIMAIASRRRSKDLPPGINFNRLCDIQKYHLSEIAVSPVLGHGKSSMFNLPSLYAVQAFLLCTLWPPPTASFNADMSWNSSGIAILTAVRAGLHCPGHGHDFERIFRSNKAHRTNIREQLITWLAVNALGQAIANMFGYPSQAKFQAHRQYLFNNVELPPRVRHMYEIQRNAYDIQESLGQLGQGNGSPSLETSMATSLIRVHAARYDQIEAEFGAEMDAWTLFTLHSGRAQLFSYYLFGEPDENGVLALYNSCLALLNHVVLQPDEYMKYLPVVSIMILWQTASVVARLYHSKWSNNLDKQTGERLYSRIVKKIQLSSVFEHDLPYRASEIMAQMWGAFSAMHRSKSHSSVSLKLQLRSRMSASVFFDCLWTMRESTEIRSQAPTTLTKHTAIKNESEATSSNSSTSPAPASASAAASGPIQPPPPPQPPQQQQQQHQQVSRGNEHINSVGIPPPVSPHNSQDFTLRHPSIQVSPHISSLRTTETPYESDRSTASTEPKVVTPSATGGPYPPNAWVHRQLPINALLSPDNSAVTPGHAINHIKSPNSPVSPAMSAMIEPNWADIDPEAASAIWRDVNSVMEDFGFGLGELPYISP